MSTVSYRLIYTRFVVDASFYTSRRCRILMKHAEDIPMKKLRNGCRWRRYTRKQEIPEPFRVIVFLGERVAASLGYHLGQRRGVFTLPRVRTVSRFNIARRPPGSRRFAIPACNAIARNPGRKNFQPPNEDADLKRAERLILSTARIILPFTKSYLFSTDRLLYLAR